MTMTMKKLLAQYLQMIFELMEIMFSMTHVRNGIRYLSMQIPALLVIFIY